MGDEQERFYTVRGYELIKEGKLTSGMEDYLEMIYRLACSKGYTRISDLAAALNVQPPSASKMVQKLADISLVHYRKYGLIELSDKGKIMGEFLLHRHEIIEKFLQFLTTESLLEETEKIEHNLSAATVNRISRLLDFFNERPDIKQEFLEYLPGRSKSAGSD